MLRRIQVRASWRGQALIGLIIALAIIATITAVMIGGRFGGVYGGAQHRAEMTVCGIYTEQINAAIMQYKGDNEGKYPPSLEALSKYGVVPEMYNSPGCVYQYDPSTGILTAPNGMRPGGAGDGEPGHRHHRDGQNSPDQQAAPGTLPTTTVPGPGGMSIKVPTGAGDNGASGLGGQ